MSIRYVARAYRVPPRCSSTRSGCLPTVAAQDSFDTIATQTGRSSEEVLDIVQTTVATWQEAHPHRSVGRRSR